LGGGGNAHPNADAAYINSSAPVLTGAVPTGWRAEWHGTGGGTPPNGSYTVYVICAA
jgi:hypothetical protein